jgi:copper homeostasis protein (lipoprotein)
MKSKNILLVFCLSTVLTSCIEHTKDQKTKGPKTTSTKEERRFIQEKTYTGLRIYSGRIPCADCSAIEQRLVLKGDTAGIYRLTETYKDATEDGDATVVSTGEWKFIKTKTANQLYLSQSHINDSIRTARYEFLESKLYQTQLDGEDVKPKYAYTLKKTKNR